MSALGGGMNFYGSLPDSYNIIINYNHPLITRIIETKNETLKESCEEFNAKIEAKRGEVKSVDENDKELKDKLESEIKSINEDRKNLMITFGKENDLIKQVCDLALLSNGMLKGEDLNNFIKRSFSLIK